MAYRAIGILKSSQKYKGSLAGFLTAPLRVRLGVLPASYLQKRRAMS